MSRNLIRIGIAGTSMVILVSCILVLGGHFLASSKSADTATEQLAVLAKASAHTSGQQDTADAEHLLTLASPAFEPLLLLLLGSILLLIGSGIKLMVSRKLRRSPGLVANDK